MASPYAPSTFYLFFSPVLLVLVCESYVLVPRVSSSNDNIRLSRERGGGGLGVAGSQGDEKWCNLC